MIKPNARYLARNIQAIVKIEKTVGQSLRSYFNNHNVSDAINYLRMLGFRCSACGQSITEPIVRYFDYDPDVYCYDCQKNLFI